MSICPITKFITKPLANKCEQHNNIDENIIKKYNNDISLGATANQAFASAAQNANQATLDLISSAKGGIVSEEALNDAVDKVSISAKAGQVALSGLASAGSMLALWAVDKGIEMAVTALNNYIHRVEIAKGRIEEINASIDGLNQSHRSRTDLLKEAEASYSSLAQGVNLADNTNLSLSDEDYASFIALNNKLAPQKIKFLCNAFENLQNPHRYWPFSHSRFFLYYDKKKIWLSADAGPGRPFPFASAPA